MNQSNFSLTLKRSDLKFHAVRELKGRKPKEEESVILKGKDMSDKSTGSTRLTAGMEKEKR